MLNRLRASYVAHSWTRHAAALGLCIAAIVLAMLGGGFPPWAWRLLAQSTPQLSGLLAMRGTSVIVSYTGLLLLSLTFVLLWGSMIYAAYAMLHHWLRTRLEMRDFERDLSGASKAVKAVKPMTPIKAQGSGRVRSTPGATGKIGTASTAPPARQTSSLASRQAPVMPAMRPIPATATTQKAGRNVSYNARAVGESSDSGAYTMPREYARYIYRPTAPLSVVDAEDEELAESVIHLEVGTALDSGIKRRGQPNEDSLLALPNVRPSRKGGQPLAIFVVADGMGGHGDGQEASRLAISSMHDAMQLALLDGLEDEVYEELLAEGIHNANLVIYRNNQQKQANMGTTLTAALIAGNTAYIANVGDSRTYLYREEEGLKQITRDHSNVARLVEVGAIAPQDIYTHPKRNEIYRSVGQSASVKVDTYRIPLKIGDLLLLCSDGLWEMVYDADIEQIIESSLPSTAQICDTLLQAALRGGGKDNISIIAVGVRRG
jgi:serine/threonine protein phosphatase PrpC